MMELDKKRDELQIKIKKMEIQLEDVEEDNRVLSDRIKTLENEIKQRDERIGELESWNRQLQKAVDYKNTYEKLKKRLGIFFGPVRKLKNLILK